MYIKSVNDEKHYESSGLWAHRILSPGRQRTSIQIEIRLRVYKPWVHEMEQLIIYELHSSY